MRPIVGLLSLAALGVAPATASAMSVGAQAAVAQSLDDAGAGRGVQGWIDLSLPTPGLHLSPQVVVCYMGFEEERWLRGLVGGSLTVGAALRPGVYGHLGYARDLASLESGPTYDVGGQLDYAKIPMLDLGIRAGVTAVPGRRSWVSAGLHATVGF